MYNAYWSLTEHNVSVRIFKMQHWQVKQTVLVFTSFWFHLYLVIPLINMLFIAYMD